MKKLRITVLLIFTNLLLVLSYNSCSADKDEMTPPPSGNDCENVTAKFSSQIFPLIQTKCALPECHSTASQTGGFHLTNYAEISARASAINSAVQSGIDFAMLMIQHHQNAIENARLELIYGHESAMQTMAKNIIEKQDQEISEIQTWLLANKNR